MTKKLAIKTTKKLATRKAPKRGVKGTAQTAQGAVDDMLRELYSVMGAGEINPEDLKALSASLDALSPGDLGSDEEADAKYEAQELAFEAMEAESAAQARKLAKRALRLDPECVDAMVCLTDLSARTKKEKIEGLQKAVAAGERSLGETFLRKNKGSFWLLIDTRPYMRALEQLGREMTSAGMRIDAIGVYENMLKLNPNDNQGVREPLLGLYLAADDIPGAGKLLKRYKGDRSTGFLWGRVLERFLTDDHDGAAMALRAAVRANRFVAVRLTGRKQLPATLPEMYSPGSLEEAVLCQHYLAEAWAAHKDALLWLTANAAIWK